MKIGFLFHKLTYNCYIMLAKPLQYKTHDEKDVYSVSDTDDLEQKKKNKYSQKK